MKFYDERIQKHLLKGGKIRNNTYEGSYVIYIDDNLIIKKDNGEYYTIKGQDLSSDKWEIVETKYNWDEIIKDKMGNMSLFLPRFVELRSDKLVADSSAKIIAESGTSEI